MNGIITNIRLSEIGHRQWAIVTITHVQDMPESQIVIPACESGEWIPGETVRVMAHDCEVDA